jgi:hypothetical protein
MSKVKLILASMLLVFAVGATAAASASAETAEFKIEGLEKGATVEFAETVEVNSPLLLEAEGENAKKEIEKEPRIECSKMKINHGIITNDTAGITFKSLRYEGCVDKSEEKACTLSKIETVELKDTLEADGMNEKGEKETDERFEPKTGKVIAEFKLEGASCKEREKTFKIEGDFISKKEDNVKPEDVHNLGVEVTPGSGEMKYGDQEYGALWREDLHWRPRIPTLNWFLL